MRWIPEVPPLGGSALVVQRRWVDVELAPIGVTTYSRLQHLRQTIAALQASPLAQDSELCVFSDAPRPGDEAKVEAVRSYLATVDGFKRVEIVTRSENSATQNARQGIRRLLDEHGRLIFLEDDILTAPGFLTFMNEALEAYERHPKVFSITGYCPPIRIPPDYPHDVFLLPRFCAWGFGIWKSRFDLVSMALPKAQVSALLWSWRASSDFGVGGLDMLSMLKKEIDGKINALDVKMFYHQYLLRMETIYPVGSLVRNTGLDGSGMHSPKSRHKDVRLDSDRTVWRFPSEIERESRIVRANFRYRLRGPRWYKPTRGLLWLMPFLIYRRLHDGGTSA